MLPPDRASSTQHSSLALPFAPRPIPKHQTMVFAFTSFVPTSRTMPTLTTSRCRCSASPKSLAVVTTAGDAPSFVELSSFLARDGGALVLCGAVIGQADVPDLHGVLGREWNNLGDLYEAGVAKAEQETHAGVIRQPLWRQRVAKPNREVVRQYGLLVIPGAGEEELAKGALGNQSQEAWLKADLPTGGQEAQSLQGPCIALGEGNVQARCLISRRKLRNGAIQTHGQDAILVSQSGGGEHNECDKKRGAFH